MATTTTGLPYPVLTDTPDVPYWMQQLAQTIESKGLSAQPRCKIVTGVAQNINNAAAAAVVDFAGGSVAYDNAGMADLANDRIKITKAGFYVLSASCRWNNSTGGYKSALITRNGSDFLGDLYVPSLPTSAAQPITFSTEPIQLAVNDMIDLRVTQTTGAVCQLVQVNARWSHLAAAWVGAQ